MGCSDILKDVWDFVEDFAKAVVDVIIDVVTDIWRKLVMPILEKIFALLGFEGMIIVNSYVMVRPLYTNGFLSPYKKAIVNRLKEGTDLMQEIKNIFLIGEHVRIRKYIKYGTANSLNPDSYMLMNDINLVEAQRIIETDVESGSPITILTGIITTPNTISHGFKYLIDNPGLTGYDFDQNNQTLTAGSGAVYVLDPTDPFVFDVVFDGYDIDVWLINFQSYTIKSAFGPNEPSTSYYAVVDDPAFQTVTIDTATNSYVEITDDEIFFMDVTADTLQDVIPTQILPPVDAQPTHYEIRYVLNSESDRVLWWVYDMIENDLVYPDLYADRTSLPADSDPNYNVLPIAPIKVDNFWVEDNKGAQTYILTEKLLKKFGLDILEISEAFRDPDAGGGSNDIIDIFFMFGINIATIDSEPSLDYLWDFFGDLIVNTTGTGDEYIAYQSWKSDYELLNAHAASDFSTVDIFGVDVGWTGPVLTEADFIALEKYSSTFKVIRDNPAVVMNPGDPNEYVFCPLVRTAISGRCMTDYDAAAANWGEGLLNVDNGNTWNASFIIQSEQFNASYNYGPAIKEVGLANPVDLFLVKDIEKEIIPADSSLVLRKRDPLIPGLHDKLTLYNLTGFHVIQQGTDTVRLTALDFVGDDAAGTNIPNNFILPITYSHLDSLGIVARQQVLQEAANIVLYGYQVTELDWYETPAFLKFFDFVLKVAAIVYIWFTADAEGAALLWTAVKYYGAKIVIERILQKIILDNPDSDLAIALAVVYGIIASVYGDASTLTDYALTALHATSTVTTVYVDVKSDILSEEFTDWTESTKEEQERLQEAFDKLDTDNQSLIDYIKKQVTIRLETPDVFMTRTLHYSPSDEFLNLANRLDLDFILEKPTDTIIETT